MSNGIIYLTMNWNSLSFQSEMFQWRNCLFGKSLNEFSWQSTFNAPSPGHSCISSYMCNCTSENLLCWGFFLIENTCGYVLILNTVRIFSKSICGGFILCPLGSTVYLPCPLKLLILRFFFYFFLKVCSDLELQHGSHFYTVVEMVPLSFSQGFICLVAQ